MAKLPGIAEYFATVGAPAINFGRGLLGYQDPFMTQTMQDRMAELEAEKGPTGNVGYEDYGLETATPGGRFTGGLMGLALNNPVDFGLAGSIGRYSYSPQGRTGLTYDFTPDQDTGTTGNAMLDFINAGGLKGAISKMGTAQAAEVTPTRSLGDVVMEARKNEPMDIEDFLGTSVPQNVTIGQAPNVFDINTIGDPALNPGSVNVFGVDPFGVNEDLIDRGNPLGDSRVVSEEQGLVGGIPDRGRGMPGAPTGAYEMIGGTPVAVGDVLGRQQALEKADFYEEPSNIDLGNFFDKALGLASLAYTGPYQGIVKGVNLANNIRTGKVGQIAKGVGSLGSKFSRTMRGVNPDGTTRTQSQYDAAREARRTQSRIDNMLARKAAGKSYSEKNLSDLIGQQIAGRADKTGKGKKSGFTNPGKNSYGPHSGGGGSSSGGGKIVCTMMNDSYGFGNFRNKIWLKHSRDLPKEYEIGYHTIFLPLVKFAKGEGKLNKVVKKTLEHIARHRTYDLKQEMKGKTHLLGRAYRKVLEPICYIVGKASMFTRRG